MEYHTKRGKEGGGGQRNGQLQGGGADSTLDDINTTHVYSGARCYDNKTSG